MRYCTLAECDAYATARETLNSIPKDQLTINDLEERTKEAVDTAFNTADQRGCEILSENLPRG